MTDRELMQQALDALEGYARNCKCEGGGAPCDAAAALRARLAQPEQEPVAWIKKDRSSIEVSIMSAEYMMEEGFDPLYTAPPQRDEAPAKAVEWQGLTQEDKREIIDETEPEDRGYVMALVEAKLKEKNT